MGVVAVDGLCDDHFMFIIGGVFGKPTENFQPLHLAWRIK